MPRSFFRWPKPVQTLPALGSCDFSVMHKPLEDVSDILGLYDRFRAYCQHEDGLINSRLTWSLTAHGFLFAIFGILCGKVADVFLEFHKTPTSTSASPVMLESVISALLFFQVLVAIVGGLVGYLARGAIVAAHNALRHLYAISQASAALCVTPTTGRVVTPISLGHQTIFPDPAIEVKSGTLLLVYHPENEKTINEEIVMATSADGDSFTADFVQKHSPGAHIRPLGSALLPKIICGGDKGFHTDAAPAYYLNLPFLVMIIWCFLFVIALALLVATLAFRVPFFKLLGVK